MGRVIGDRIDYGVAEHVKSVLFRAVGLQYPQSFGDVVADKLGIGACLRSFDAIGDHRHRIWLGHTYLSIGVGSYSTHTPATPSKWHRPLQRAPLPTGGKAASRGARNKGSGIDGAGAPQGGSADGTTLSQNNREHACPEGSHDDHIAPQARWSFPGRSNSAATTNSN